ncbi:MAG: hypothetical protein HY720_08365 [Planctomycetes bacterium]|nr:hypothetical protein [Planctomycetota bacterium]
MPEQATTTSEAFQRLRETAAVLASPDSDLTPEDRTKLRARLDTSAWEVFGEVAGSCVLDDLQDDLPLTEKDRNALDYGLFGLGLGPWEDEMAQAAQAARAEPVPGVSFVTDALRAEYRRFLRIDEGRSLYEKQKGIQERLELAGVRTESLKKTRDRILGWVLSSDAKRKLDRTLAETEEMRERFLLLQRKVDHGQLKDTVERREFAEAKEKMIRLREERDRILADASGAPKALSLDRRVDKVFFERLDLQDELAATGARIDVFHTEAREMNPRQARAALVEELRSLRMFTKMGAQRARSQPETAPIGKREIATPRKIAEALDHILAFDPRLFDNSLARREGRPTILLVPGTGYGIFDWAKRRLVVPTIPYRSVPETLAYAIATYRDDVDAQTNERTLLKSYGALKVNENSRSSMKLKGLLAKDYITWMTRDSKGLATLDPENREWIEENIAPRPEEPILTREMIDLAPRERRGLLKRLEGQAGGLDAEDLYRLGVLRFWGEEFVQAAECFDKALEAKPCWPEAIYSSGVSHKRAGRSLWKERLSEFVRIAPQSWWPKKAQRMLAK